MSDPRYPTRLGYLTRPRKEQITVHIMLNAFWKLLGFELPTIAGAWRRWVETSLPAPEDIVEWQKAPAVSGST